MGLFDLWKIENCLSLRDEKWSEWVEEWTQFDAKVGTQMALDLH